MSDALRRLIAAFVAVVLVVAALIWRSHRTNDGNAAPTTTSATAAPRIVCSTELEDVCKQAFVNATIEPAGTTADDLTKPGAIVDLWLTLDPWPTVVAE